MKRATLAALKTELTKGLAIVGYSMLKWDETDLIDFFGIVPNYCDDAHSHLLDVSRDGLRLLITIFDLEGTVYVSIFREGLPEPLFTVRRDFCTHAQITQGEHFRRCFEVGVTKYPVSEMGIPPVLVRGVRVYIEPHFQVALIEPRYECG
jgi:hypothetical protein